MIVNPQLFNYRLIIGSLVVLMAILSVFVFSSFESSRAHQKFLEQEKKLVETELSQMIAHYDELSSSQNFLTSTLDEAKKSTRLVLDSLRLLKSDLSVITRFKSQLVELKHKNQHLFATIDSLEDANDRIEGEKLLLVAEMNEQRNANTSLKKENQKLSKTIEKAAILTANSFKAKAFKNIKGTLEETKRADKAETIEVCFTLVENILTEKGAKELFIQIVNPKNNVLADQGAIEFGDSLLIYSTKTVVDYNNQVVDVCTNIHSEAAEQPLIKGTYYVSVFHKDKKLGSTQIILD